MNANIADSVVKQFESHLSEFLLEASEAIDEHKSCDLRLNSAIEGKQLEDNEYETRLDGNRQLQQQIAKCEADMPVNAQKRTLELQHENAHLMTQLESLNKEVVSLKREYRESRKRLSNMECAASDRQTRHQMRQNANLARINRMNSINARMDSLEKQLSFIANFRADIINWLKMSDEYNTKAEAMLKLKGERLQCAKNENMILTHKLIEAQSNAFNQTKHNEEAYEISRLNAVSELQNKEIEELSKLLADAHKRKSWLLSLMSKPIDEMIRT